MSVVIIQKSVAAGASESLLKDTNLEFVQQNSMIEIALATTAVGVVSTVTSGSDVLMEESPVFVLAAGVAPKYPDDYTLTDVAAAGERLVIKARNTTGGALTVTAAVRATPV
jgi:predicted dienelactone hydrolase